MVSVKIAGLLSRFVVIPIWFYLMFSILSRVGATDVMWLLYWVYVPISALASILIELAKGAFK